MFENIMQKLRKFRDDRGWKKFHTDERVSQACHNEAGELSQLFQWGKEPEKERIEGEAADVAIYLLYLCDQTGVDLELAIYKKIAKNAVKYPKNVDNAKVNGWK